MNKRKYLEMFDERKGYVCKPVEGVSPDKIREWLHDNNDERKLIGHFRYANEVMSHD
jgi:hypothetical protein